jgi:hypothetical protein
MSLSKPLLERLVVTKYMVTQARLVLGSSAPFSAGIAVGQLQDAVELFLRILAEHFHAALKERTTFDQLIGAVAAVLPGPLTHRTSLNQLNKSRVNFKHFALEPRREDAEKLLHDVESFIPGSSSQFLLVDYSDLSLSSALQHRRTENWLRKAEHLMDTDDYRGAIDAAAVALAVYRRCLGVELEKTRLDRYGKYGRGELSDLIKSTQDEFDNLRSQLDLVLTGTNLSQYRVFLRFAPSVRFTMAGTLHVVGRLYEPLSPTRDHALLCYSFAVDTALALKKTHIPGRFQRQRPIPQHQVEVTSESDVVVYPKDPIEVIRTAVPGEVLDAIGRHEQDGFLPVIQDDDVAYISRNSVRDLEGGAT